MWAAFDPVVQTVSLPEQSVTLHWVSENSEPYCRGISWKEYEENILLCGGKDAVELARFHSPACLPPLQRLGPA